MSTETTLVTGASSGIGLHLAHEFARHGHPLVLVAPVAEELEKIGSELTQVYGVRVQVIAKDLEQADAANEIAAELTASGTLIDILVNNAGHGFHGKWWEQPLEQDLSMLRLNVEAPLRLTKLFLPLMVQRGRGRILNTASIAAYMPGPLFNTYHSTKAFLLSWSDALHVELEGTDVTVTALCPGVTDTDFFPKADMLGVRGYQQGEVMAPQEVAKIGYDALMKGEISVVAGAMNKAMVQARRLMSEEAQAHLQKKFQEEVPPEKQTKGRGVAEDAATAKAQGVPVSSH